MRINRDGNQMNDNVRQLLLEEFAEFYDPRIRLARERYEEQLEIAEFLGNGEIPKNFTDEIIESLQRPEIMDIDFSQFQTRREQVIPPEIKRFVEQNRPNTIVRAVQRFLNWFRR